MSPYSRREFLSMAANSSLLAAAEFGSKKVNRLIPYVTPPEQFHAGKWLFYNTTCRECPAGCGMHLRYTNGRAVKAEGNPQHPVNQGGLCPRGQACVQGLYNPDRFARILHKGQAGMEWKTALNRIAEGLKSTAGRILLVSNLQTGMLDAVFRQFLEQFGERGKLMYWEPFNYEPQRNANRRVFGVDALPFLHLDKTELIVSFGADFLEGWISNVQWTRQFKKMHHVSRRSVGKMVYIGPRRSMTAANADEFIQVTPSQLPAAAAEILRMMVQNGWVDQNENQIIQILDSLPQSNVIDQDKLKRLARAFGRSSSVALAGPTGGFGKQAENLSVAVNLLNFASGSYKQIIDFSRPHALSRCVVRQDLVTSLSGLTKEDVVIFHNCNPAYNLPGGGEFIRQAGTVIYAGVMPDETSQLADWILPVDHYLEMWGDYEPWEGLQSLIQPAVRRLYLTRSAGDIMQSLGRLVSGDNRQADDRYDEQIKAHWHNASESVFRQGGSWTQPREKRSIDLKNADLLYDLSQSEDHKPELWLWPSVMLYDGRAANHNWLQENPEPMSQIAWGNCAEISQKTAAEYHLSEGDGVQVKNASGQIKLPIRITDDICEGTVSLCFGQGHTALGRYAAGIGASAFALNGPTQEFFEPVTIQKTANHKPLISLADSRDQHERHILQWEEYRKLDEGSAKREEIILPLPEDYTPERDMYPPHEHKDHRWAMVIDLDKCIGCGACAVACYAENNIAVMGPEPLRHGREMAWLKVVPYEHPETKNRIGFLPMLCQHCDAAPCEPVCPVFAAVHNEEGLNAQIYNRCIGTRYCSNNCPYKVRRFNWFDPEWPDPLHLQLNPEVTVRCRGVMEKCTFCIQRIKSAELKAKMQGRPLTDGEIQPACVQSCPAGVLTFGDLMNKQSTVFDMIHHNPRRYQVLRELNTKPAVFYLKKIQVRNLT